MIKFIDAHCHFARTPLLINDSIGHICNATQESDWGEILTMAQTCKNIFPCIGIHPWAVSSASCDWDTRMRELLQRNPHAMVGEIGLDKLHPDYDLQRAIFTTQFAIATDLRRVAHLHCVRAWDEIMRAISLHNIPPEIINATTCRANVYYSYGPAVLDDRHRKLRDAIVATPTDKILIETDLDTNATDVNLLTKICDKIAKLKNIDSAIMANTIYKNTTNIIDTTRLQDKTF